MPDQTDSGVARRLFSLGLVLFFCVCFWISLPLPLYLYVPAGAGLGAGFCFSWLHRLRSEGDLAGVVAGRLKLSDCPSFLGSELFYYVLHVLSWSVLWPGLLGAEVLKHPFPFLKGDLD